MSQSTKSLRATIVPDVKFKLRNFIFRKLLGNEFSPTGYGCAARRALKEEVALGGRSVTIFLSCYWVKCQSLPLTAKFPEDIRPMCALS